MILFDLQSIRKEKKITQKQLAELVQYPQGFISEIESGKASAPQAFIKKVSEQLKIENIDDYVKEVPNISNKKARKSKKEDIFTDILDAGDPIQNQNMNVLADQSIISMFLDLLRKKEEKIDKLEAENRFLRDELLNLKLGKCK